MAETALVLDAGAKGNGSYVLSALEKADKFLDIVLVNLPQSLNAAEVIIREIYGYCLSKADKIDCVVYPFLTKKYDWVYSPIEVDGITTKPIEAVECPPLTETPSESQETTIHKHKTVAVGGTFDHFHIGHKLLLTVTGLWCSKRLIVGITGPELLKNKKYAEQLDSYNKRKEEVGKFVTSLYPKIVFDAHEINDIYGPTGTEEDIDGIVVSQETSSGGEAVNKYRQAKKWNALEVFQIGLIEALNGAEKLSSTQLRQRDAEATKTKI